MAAECGRQFVELLGTEPWPLGVWLLKARAITAADRVLLYEVGMLVFGMLLFLLTTVFVGVTFLRDWKWVGEVLSGRPSSGMIFKLVRHASVFVFIYTIHLNDTWLYILLWTTYYSVHGPYVHM